MYTISENFLGFYIERKERRKTLYFYGIRKGIPVFTTDHLYKRYFRTEKSAQKMIDRLELHRAK